MKMFWTLFVLDACVTGGFLLNALIGVALGGGDAGAILLFLLLVGGTVAVLGGSLRLKSRRRMRAANTLLLSVALLPVLIGLGLMVMLAFTSNSL